MIKIQIETITEKEFNEFYQLFSRLVKTQFPEYSRRSREWLLSSPRAYTQEGLKKVIKDGSRFILGAYPKKIIRGFIYGEPPFGGISIVYWLAVDSSFQRQGIGRDLLTAWEKKVKDLGAHAIHLLAAKRNLVFYEKLGYELVGLVKKSYFGVDDCFLMKLLQEPKENNFLK